MVSIRLTPAALAPVLLAAGFAVGDASAADTMLRNLADMKFTTLPGFPTCATGSVQNGDPATQPSIVLAKLGKGCSIPWHWHTANEHLMMTSGEARLEMKDGGKPQTLRAGGFARMPAQHVHRFECASKNCLLYVYADSAPFDIHYVDAQGKEIPPEDALKAVRETVAKPAAK